MNLKSQFVSDVLISKFQMYKSFSRPSFFNLQVKREESFYYANVQISMLHAMLFFKNCLMLKFLTLLLVTENRIPYCGWDSLEG